MKLKTILCLTLISCGNLLGWPSLALANLGENFSQINARYGKPLQKLSDAGINDKAVTIYRYEYNGRRIFIEFMDGKSASESIRAPEDNPNFSDKKCLAMAAVIAGSTNWTELSRNDEDVVWVASNATASLRRNTGKPEYFFVSSMKYNAHQMQLNQVLASPSSSAIDNSTHETKVETKQSMAASVLKWHQELADKGDRYGEYCMGLHYLKGDGVPEDLDKAREIFQKSADQGNADAALALSKLPPQSKLASTSSKSINPSKAELDAKVPDLTIQSAEFGMGNNVVDVTARVSELMSAQSAGFIVNAQSLGKDPLPGKKKQLTIRYSYKGTDRSFTIQAATKLSYQALVKNASK